MHSDVVPFNFSAPPVAAVNVKSMCLGVAVGSIANLPVVVQVPSSNSNIVANRSSLNLRM